VKVPVKVAVVLVEVKDDVVVTVSVAVCVVLIVVVAVTVLVAVDVVVAVEEIVNVVDVKLDVVVCVVMLAINCSRAVALWKKWPNLKTPIISNMDIFPSRSTSQPRMTYSASFSDSGQRNMWLPPQSSFKLMCPSSSWSKDSTSSRAVVPALRRWRNSSKVISPPSTTASILAFCSGLASRVSTIFSISSVVLCQWPIFQSAMNSFRETIASRLASKPLKA